MKKIALFAVALLLGADTMFAQQGGGRQRMSVEERVAQMSKELSLTAEQQQKITALYTDFESKHKEGTRLDREQMRAEMEKFDQQVQAVLTDEQKKKYEEAKKKRQRRRR